MTSNVTTRQDKSKVNKVHSTKNKCKWTNQTLEKSMDVVKDGHVHQGSQINYGTYYLLTSFSNYMNDKTRY